MTPYSFGVAGLGRAPVPVFQGAPGDADQAEFYPPPISTTVYAEVLPDQLQRPVQYGAGWYEHLKLNRAIDPRDYALDARLRQFQQEHPTGLRRFSRNDPPPIRGVIQGKAGWKGQATREVIPV